MNLELINTCMAYTPQENWMRKAGNILGQNNILDNELIQNEQIKTKQNLLCVGGLDIIGLKWSHHCKLVNCVEWILLTEGGYNVLRFVCKRDAISPDLKITLPQIYFLLNCVIKGSLPYSTYFLFTFPYSFNSIDTQF